MRYLCSRKDLLMEIRCILNAIEEFAPRALQEGYDNAGLQAGDAANDCTGVLLTLDVSERTVEEAAGRNCNLIISHHPLLFKGIKSIAPSTAKGRILMRALCEGITLYAAHTNLDNARGGVSFRMAEMMGLKNIRTLCPQKGTLVKLVVFVPADYVADVRDAMLDNGAGNVGDYDRCSYAMDGIGSFRPKPGAHPFSGICGELHEWKEIRLEMIVPLWKAGKVVEAMVSAHPYEEPAYDIIPLANADCHSGSGIVGDVEPVSLGDFLLRLKEVFATKSVRYTGEPSATLRRVAMCGGSGASMTSDAIAAGADLYVSGDFKYHDFTEYRESIALADIGHYESEQCAKLIFRELISRRFPDLPVYFSETDINPINYI